MKLLKNPTINDFLVTVHPDEIERVLGKRRSKNFWKWMNGQTMSEYGAYVGDLERYLKGLTVID